MIHFYCFLVWGFKIRVDHDWDVKQPINSELVQENNCEQNPIAPVHLIYYNTASLVTTNNELRKTIRKHTLQSNLLDLIGHAEMEKEIQKTVTDIIDSQEIYDIHTERQVELDEKE